jgi:predicted lysophospholipase L1 biosynthesis ABC-type transport system permease subunit
MFAGRLSLRLCFHWANHAPREVPLLNGEWWFIAVATPEVADADELSATAPSEDRTCPR